MGYTTEFKGSFELDRQLSKEHAAELLMLADYDRRAERKPGAPEGYCQWEPTRLLDGIRWDGGEKFYRYTEWLQHIIDAYLKPWGYKLTGSVRYEGEERGDVGVLSIVDDKVVKGDIPRTSAEKRAIAVLKYLREQHRIDVEFRCSEDEALADLAKIIAGPPPKDRAA